MLTKEQAEELKILAQQWVTFAKEYEAGIDDAFEEMECNKEKFETKLKELTQK